MPKRIACDCGKCVPCQLFRAGFVSSRGRAIGCGGLRGRVGLGVEVGEDALDVDAGAVDAAAAPPDEVRGAGHLAGPDSVQRYLRDRGIASSRISAPAN